MSGLTWDEIKPAFEALGKRLDYIEDHLVRMGQSGGFAYAPYSTTFGPVPDEVRELARAGKTLQAIKAYREATGADFEQARGVVLGL